jgi:hypothetical protein
VRLGLVLLPEQGASDACVRYARALALGRPARVVLGPGALPHVSLLHVETDEDPAALWNEARAALDASYRLDVLALGMLRYDTPYNAPAASPATMAWLIVPCSSALRAAERTAISLPFVRRARVTTANGEIFQPHVTLAIWERETPPPVTVLPKELFTNIEARLALGVIGANGVYERSLFEA